MIDAIPCPQAEDLQRFLLGEMEDADAERLELHLSQCRSCVTTAQGLKASDTLVEAMRAGIRGVEYIEIRADEALIARMCRLRQSAAVSPWEDAAEKTAVRTAAATPSLDGVAFSEEPRPA
jgi:hypothetical protein